MQWRARVEQPERDLVERRMSRADLCQHVDAVTVFLDHPRDPAHQAFDARQASEYLVLGCGVPQAVRERRTTPEI
jgi:hypothetical protein